MFRDEDYGKVTRAVLDNETVELLMRYAFVSSSEKAASQTDPSSTSHNPHLLLEAVKIELLKVNYLDIGGGVLQAMNISAS